MLFGLTNSHNHVLLTYSAVSIADNNVTERKAKELAFAKLSETQDHGHNSKLHNIQPITGECFSGYRKIRRDIGSSR